MSGADHGSMRALRNQLAFAMDHPTLELKIDTMSCGHCVHAITQAVQTLDPGAKVQADLASKLVTVQTDKPREAVTAALEEAGYAAA